jgi:hypothetical protein
MGTANSMHEEDVEYFQFSREARNKISVGENNNTI